MKERRRYKRYRLERTAYYDSLELSFKSRIADIGLGGIFLRSDFLDEPGTEVELCLDVPMETSPLMAPGKVVFAGEKKELGAGMGIAFIKLSPEQQRLLLKYLKQFNKDGPFIITIRKKRRTEVNEKVQESD